MTTSASSATGGWTAIQAPVADRPLADPAARLWARIIDILLLLAVMVPVFVLVMVYLVHDVLTFDASAPLDRGDIGFPWQLPVILLLFGVLFAGLPFVYEVLLLRRDGQTIGKKIAGVRVVRLSDGQRPTWTEAFLRTLTAGVLSGIYLDALWCLWDRPWRQCLHDKAVGTIVVPSRASPARGTPQA